MNHNAKLTPPQIRAIRKFAKDKATDQKNLALMFHVSQSTISKIVNKKTWRARV